MLADCPPPNNFKEDLFEQTFSAMDKNQDNLIQKNEMLFFIKNLLAGQWISNWSKNSKNHSLSCQETTI